MEAGPTHSQLIATMERLLLETFPPLETSEHDGVTVGSSHGATGRANSAVVSGAIHDIDATVSWANDWLAARDRIPLFRLSPLAPSALTSRLNMQNAYNTTSCLHASLTDLPSNDIDTSTVEITSAVPSDWISERDAAGQAEVQALMKNVTGELAWALIRDGEVPVAAGRGVLVDRWLCVQAMYTLPQERGRGLATCVLSALHRWAIGHGATNAFLNVLATNESARSVYDRQGYTHVYDYTYVKSANRLPAG